MTNVAKFHIHESMFDDELDLFPETEYHVSIALPNDDYDPMSLITSVAFE